MPFHRSFQCISVHSLVCDLYNGVDLRCLPFHKRKAVSVRSLFFVTFIMVLTCAVCHSTGQKTNKKAVSAQSLFFMTFTIVLTCAVCRSTGEKPFQCEVCGAAFSTSSNLAVHRRTHTGERPFQCDKCGAAFSQLGHLTRHSMQHSTEHAYRCTSCQATFGNAYHLKVSC